MRQSEPGDRGRRSDLRWWREVLIAVGFYAVYTLIRDLTGGISGDGADERGIAFRHARSIIHIERSLGLWFEPRLQHWYLGLPAAGGIRFWNIFYGTLHFIVTIGVLIVLFRRRPERYRFLRTALAATTALALAGFTLFSLMPPRLLDDNSSFGACAGRAAGCHGFGIVDTIAIHGGLWQFGKGAMSNVSNQFAAMPSLHFGWSSWCAIALIACFSGRAWRWLALLYPLATLFCILVTGNHYWIDAAAGAVTLSFGLLIAVLFERVRAANHRRAEAHVDAGPSPSGDELNAAV